MISQSMNVPVSILSSPLSIIREPDHLDFLQKLQELAKQGYIFRGHQNSSWLLRPHAFRNPKEPHKEKILLEPASTEISRFTSILQQCDPQLVDENHILRYMAGNVSTNHPNPSLVFQQIGKIRRNSFIQLVSFVMEYGAKFAQFHQENPQLDPHSQSILVRERNAAWWRDKEKTFPYFLSGYIEAKTVRISIKDGTVTHSGTMDNTLCAFDETYAQHYYLDYATLRKEGTTLLDWTRDPLVALYFAVGNKNKEDQKPFSIFAFNPREKEENVVRIVEGDLLNNERLRAQKGCFTRFEKAAEDFLNNGKWPTLEEYYNDNTDPWKVELIKYDLAATTAEFFQQELKRRNINAKTLCLEEGANKIPVNIH